MGNRIELSPYYYAILSDDRDGQSEIFFEGLETTDIPVGEITRHAAEEWGKSARDARALWLLSRPKQPRRRACSSPVKPSTSNDE